MSNRNSKEIALAANLRKLCSHYASISDVARKIGINRQQLNKYLSGSSYPSLHNLRRITDFFGVDEFEILLAPEEFSERVLPDRPTRPQKNFELLNLIPKQPDSAQEFLAPYEGYYNVYFFTPVWSNHIVRALTRVRQVDGRTETRTIERIREPGSRERAGVVQKFRGHVFQVVDRLCVLEYESQVEELMSMTFLYPSHRHTLHLLTGVMVGIASGGSRPPFAARVVYEFIGRQIDGREALGACGLFLPDDEAVPNEIRSRIRNTISPGESVLLPSAY